MYLFETQRMQEGLPKSSALSKLGPAKFLPRQPKTLLVLQDYFVDLRIKIFESPPWAQGLAKVCPTNTAQKLSPLVIRGHRAQVFPD